jgi:hypothetical protein
VFNFNATSQEEALDEAIDDLLADLKGGVGSDFEAHTTATENLIKLLKLKHEINPAWRPSPDAVLAAGVSIASVLLVLHFEKLGVITSKAFGFLGKMK